MTTPDPAGTAPVRVAFGTAALFGELDDGTSRHLLETAVQAGVRWVDTAPSYGEGRAEERVGAFLRAAAPDRQIGVTSKVGLRAPTVAGGVRTVAKAMAVGLLPAGVSRRLRDRSRAARAGHFEVSEAVASIDLSLRRLGRIDRLLLHEVVPDDIDDGLLAVLAGYRDRGDVGAVGVATRNESTAAALARAPGLFTVAHVAVGLLAEPAVLPAGLTTRVGHGLLGPGGADLRALGAVLTGGGDAAAAWSEATAGTPWTGPGGLAAALLARSGDLDLTDVIVSSSRPAAVAESLRWADGSQRVPEPVAAALAGLAVAARRQP